MHMIGIAINGFFYSIISLILGISWLAGFAFSGSAWCIIPFYAWYVVIEKAMSHYHIFGYVS